MRGRGTRLGRALILLVASACALTLLLAGQTGLGDTTVQAQVPPVPLVVPEDHHDTSPPLTILASQPDRGAAGPHGAGPAGAGGPGGHVQPLGVRSRPAGGASPTVSAGRDPATASTSGTAKDLPGPLVSFDGARDTDNIRPGNVGVVEPSDSEGDIGPNHYVEWVNQVIQIFDKQGHTLLGPVNGNTLFSGFGGACETQNDGDPIVLYDRQADRWLVSQFALPAGGPSHECIGISATPDPTGAYHRYDFVWPLDKVNDYPKFGVWPDAYYVSANQFDQGFTTFLGVGVGALNRSAMLRGAAATLIYFDLEPSQPDAFSLLPSHLNGSTPPPAGSPNYFVEIEAPELDPFFPADRIQVWKFHVDFASPGSSTFTGPTVLSTAPFDPLLCGTNPFEQDCIPQPATPQRLDALADRAMYRNNYRNFGDHEALVFNHTIDADGTGRAGVRWYELRLNAGTPSIFQQGTFAPDGIHRWMGSANFDAVGDIAVGYSASSSTVFPSLRYAARLVSDPPGTLGQGEGTLFTGTGSQAPPFGRWGDYSTLSIDPVDDCTFWYINQYYAVTSSFNWITRITSFKIPGCFNGGDLAITKTGQGAAAPGTNVTFTITVKNNGPLAASNVVVGDATPPGLTFVSNAGDCTTAFPCNLGTLAPGATRTITATFAVPTAYAGPNPIVNTATVSSTTADADATNNSATATVSTLPGADLSVTKVGPPVASPGTGVVYTLTVTNNGPVQAENVTVNDPTPPGLTFTSNGGDCATAFPCNLGALPPGQSRTIASSFLIAAAYAGPDPIVNTATVSSSTADPNPANNTASAKTTPQAYVPANEDKDKGNEQNSRTRQNTEERRQQHQLTNASNLDDTRIIGYVREVHLDEQPPFIVVRNADGDVKVELYGDAAKLTIRPTQYFTGTGSKENEGLFRADQGSVENVR